MMVPKIQIPVCKYVVTFYLLLEFDLLARCVQCDCNSKSLVGDRIYMEDVHGIVRYLDRLFRMFQQLDTSDPLSVCPSCPLLLMDSPKFSLYQLIFPVP